MTSIPEDAPREETSPQPEPVPDAHATRFALRMPRAIPTRTLPLLGLLLVIGLAALAFTCATVHARTPAQIAADAGFARMHFTVEYWLEHGYFHFAGLLVRPNPNPPGYYVYLSSSGIHMVTAFLVEWMWKAVTGHTSIQLLALHGEVVTLLAAALLGLLAFRLARRMGTPPLHALVLAASLEVVHFTFPDNLAMFWELSGRQPFLVVAAIFLLIEERCAGERTRARTIAQAIAAFLLTYIEYTAGVAFLGSYLVIGAVFSQDRIRVRTLLAVTILPALLALGIFALQRKCVTARYPDAPTYGATFLFRTGLDGSTKFYGDHLDIAYRRVTAVAPGQTYKFTWKWTFVAGTAALLIALVFATRGRVPAVATTSLLSLLGTYLLYGALFSQAFAIHPYLFDVLLYTPLVLALFVFTPALLESLAEHRGIIIVAVFFLAVWLTMAQLRDYAVWYPLPAAPAAATSTQ